MTEPTDDEIEAAARAGLSDTEWAELPSITRDALWDEAEDALAAALPLVEARLREEIAGEIVAEYAKVAADEGATLEDDRIITAICNGLLRARRVVRGQ